MCTSFSVPFLALASSEQSCGGYKPLFQLAHVRDFVSDWKRIVPAGVGSRLNGRLVFYSWCYLELHLTADRVPYTTI